MKQQYVEGLQEGDLVNDYFLATRRDLRTQQSGGKFLGMVFKDRTGEIGGILWNNAAAVARLFEVGDVVQVRGSVTRYQDRLQVRVDQVLPLKEEEYDTKDLVFVPDDIQDNLKAFKGLLADIENPWLKKLVDAFLDDDGFRMSFTSAAAGKKWHHAHRGGLLRHCYEMAKVAQTMAELFPSLDQDLLLTAILLHDVGKLDEMSHDLCVDYTTPGRLLGHVMIGAGMVEERMQQIEGFPETLRLQLLHCVLSHHGELTNGSPVLPKTLEATVLYHIDNLDAQADAIERVIDEARSQGLAWSEYIPLIERPIWTKME